MLAETDLPRLREKERQDKKWFKRYLIGFPCLVMIVSLFATIDVYATAKISAEGSIISLKDTWTFKHGRRCQTFVLTPAGPTYVWNNGYCAQYAWRPGEPVDIVFSIGRLTRWILIGRMMPHFKRLAS